jgi:hypothetical protein
MGLLQRLFGFRWSLYVVRDDNELVYVMHENNPLRMIGYVMHYFAAGAAPVTPWALHMNFNKQHQSFKLGPEHFAENGGNVSALLIQQIEKIDPGWRVRDGEPVFMEASTKRSIPLTSVVDLSDRSTRLRTAQSPKETTFFTVMYRHE